MKTIKRIICASTLSAMCICFYGCNSSSGNESIVGEITEAITENATESSVETLAENSIINFEQEAKETFQKNDYTKFDLGYISLDLPWIDRCYPQEVTDDLDYFSCDQGNLDSSVPPDCNSVFISIDKQGIKSISDYDEWFQETDYAKYSSKLLNSENLGEVQYYKYRSYKTDNEFNPTEYYTAYCYVFYDRDKSLIRLEMEFPENWSFDGQDMAQHIYESIQLPEGHYPENDFLSSDDNRKVFLEYRNQGKYSELYELLQQHIKSDNIKENDSAYKAIEVLDKIMPYMDDVNIEYDEIDEKGTIKYKTVNDISSEIHVVPIAYTTQDHINIKVGFEETDWLFFDKVTITGKEDSWSRTQKIYEKTQDVIGGGVIHESIMENINADDLFDISQNDKSVIRFENQKEDKNFEYQLSQDEINAAEVISAFDTISTDLSDLLLDYEKYKIE